MKKLNLTLFRLSVQYSLVFLLTVLLSSNAIAADINWKFFSYLPSSEKVVQTYKEMAGDIYKASKERLKITIYSAGELPYKPVDGIKIVATNKVQMADGAVGFLAGDVPDFNVYGIPFVCTTFENLFKGLKSVSPIMDQELEARFKIRTFYHWTMPPQNVWTVKPIKTLDDFKGRKIRAWNPEQVEMLKLLGAVPVSIASAEVPTSLQRGVIDGAITSALSVSNWKMYDFVHYGLMINFSMGHQFVLINSKEFKKLPTDLQELLNSKAVEWGKKFQELTPQFEVGARKNLIANGMELTELSPSDMQKAKDLMQPMWKNWTKKHGAVAEKLLELATKNGE